MSRTQEIFEGLTSDQQARVFSAVYRGDVLVDPREAVAAVRFARTLTARAKKSRLWLSRLAAVGVVTYLGVELVLALVRRSHYSVPDWPMVLLAFYLFVHVYGWYVGRRLQANAARAERLNLQFAQSAGLMAEGESDISDQDDRWTPSRSS